MVRRIALAEVGLGIFLFSLSVWGLIRDLSWIAQPFYAYAWWSYIFFLDGYCALRRGRSLLLSRSRFVFPLAVGSISFWFFFELLNLRFQNWYYVGVFHLSTITELATGGLFVAVCFSTVFLGIFETLEALTASGFLVRWKGRPGSTLSPWVSYGLQGLGAGMAAVAILFPYYWAPLIWGSFTFLIDPWNYRRGARSILQHVEAKDWGRLARIFIAGLICGIVWESLNFFAPQKWIYTVRGLEHFKLFEMPLLGFLGFPGLAFDCLAGASLLSYWFFGNQSWEDPEDLDVTLRSRPKPSRGFVVVCLALQPLFWAAVGLGMLRTSFGSIELRLEHLGLAPSEVAELESRGVRRPRQLLRACRQETRREELSEALGLAGAEMERLLVRSELYTFKGIGWFNGALLEQAGVHRVEDLAARDPETLGAELRRAAESDGNWGPRLDMVRVWILAARDRGVVLLGNGN